MERLIKKDKNNRERFTDIRVEDLKNGTAIWICQVGSHTFSVRPEGTLEVRRKFLQDQGNYIGKQLTVRYQNLTTLGIPRFPVGVVVRDYE